MTNAKEAEDRRASSCQSQRLRERVEEFRLWKDEQSFQEQEYERRRQEKIRKKGLIKSDRPLQRGRAFYIPSILLVLGGSALLLYSSLDALGGEDAPLQAHSGATKIVGGIITGAGLVALMVTAAYTYYREDAVRKSNGFPTLFESSRVAGGTASYGGRHEETLASLNEFVDRNPREKLSSGTSACGRQNLRRMVSADEQAQVNEPLLSSISSRLRDSFSSAGSTLSWLNKHESRFYSLGQILRRQNSDSALDQSFARSRLQPKEKEGLSMVDTQGKSGQMPPGCSSEDKEYLYVYHKISKDMAIPRTLSCKESRYTQTGKTRALFRHRQCAHCFCSGVHSSKGNRQGLDDEHGENNQIQCYCANAREGSGHAGVCASSTDSSGYTSSECYQGGQLELTCSNTRNADGSAPTLYSRPPHTAQRVLKSVMEDSQSCRQPEIVLVSAAAVHASWRSAENDGVSLSPPASPDISSLPYLCNPPSSSETAIATPSVLPSRNAPTVHNSHLSSSTLSPPTVSQPPSYFCSPHFAVLAPKTQSSLSAFHRTQQTGKT